MENTKTQRPEQIWAEKIMATPMPVLPGTKAKVLDLISKNAVNFKALEGLIACDPAFALHVFMRVATEGDSVVQVKTLAIAISLIGLEGVQSIAVSASEVNIVEHRGYLHSLSRSLFAASLARHWARHKNHYPADELFWSTLFYRAGYWVLWILEPEKMRKLVLAFSANPATRLTAEKDIFGCQIIDICDLLLDYWNTPKVTSPSVDQTKSINAESFEAFSAGVSDLEVSPAPDGAGVNRQINAASTTIILAHEMVDILQTQWQGEFAAQTLGQVAGHLRSTLLNTVYITQQAILDHSQNYPIPGVRASATYLFNTWPRPAPDPARPGLTKIAGIKPRTEPSKKPRLVEKQQGLEKTIDQLIEQFEHHPETVQDLQQLFYTLGMTLKRELGIKRVAIGLRDPRRASVRVSHCFGSTELSGMKGLHFDYLKSPLMSQMIKSQRNIWVKPADKAEMEKLLPSNFVDQIHSSNEFFISSLFSGKRPIGICYLDDGMNGKALKEQDYLLFKRLCKSSRFVFDSLASRPKNG
ncbi:MAG: HDOD domain-containing protein [Pseudomonadales bacterium]|nr:HDOD domain-containing protein [Pseudomonadales bacterium]